MSEATIQTDYQSQFGKGLWRYIRNRFSQAGQDSYSNPPSQNEDMFERLLNVMPPVQGDLNRRWGYRFFNQLVTNPATVSLLNPAAFPIYLYADDPVTRRQLIISNGFGFSQCDENGVSSALIYTPSPRSFQGRGVTSRGVFYWGDPPHPTWQTLSLAGNHSGKWGIDVNGTSANSVGPNSPSVAGGAAWTAPNNTFVQDSVNATQVVANQTFVNGTSNPTVFPSSVGTNPLLDSSFGFALSPSSIITGIKVEVYVSSVVAANVGTFTVPPDVEGCVFQVFLNKTGVPLFAAAPVSFAVGDPAGYISFGGPGDLWGASWNAADFNAASFSTNLIGALYWTVPGNTTVQSQQVTIAIDHVRVTLFGHNFPILATPGVSGAITLISGRLYAYAFANTSLGTFSDLSSFSISTGPVTAKKIDLTNIPISGDPQVDTVLLLATGDGGDETTLYEVGRVLNGVTIFTDNIAEEDLLLANQFQAALIDGTDVGVADNTPPPAGLTFPTLHRGRIYGIVGNNLYYSKSDDELLTPTGASAGRFEQAWPANNFFPSTSLGEIGTGLLTDGTVLYIGTDRRVIRLFGDGPATYLQPESLFDNVGVINQDVWKLVLIEGNPVGAMWLTPDYRVIGSDFNTYQDVGLPIQNVLDSINRTAAPTTAWASYVGVSVYNLYVLAVPTGTSTFPNVLLVFDIKGKRWYEWQLSDLAVSGFWWVTADGNPQFLFLASDGKLYVFDPSALLDREGGVPVGFPAQVVTSWLGMGDQTARKNLNEIEVMTGDPEMTLTVEGASSVADFAAPRAVVTLAPLVIKPRGELGVFLAGASTRDKFYRFTFDYSSSATTDLLRSINMQGRVLHRI